jgi:hypothetical protein
MEREKDRQSERSMLGCHNRIICVQSRQSVGAWACLSLQPTSFGDGLMVDVNVFNMLHGVCSGLVGCTSYTLSRGIEEQSP